MLVEQRLKEAMEDAAVFDALYQRSVDSVGDSQGDSACMGGWVSEMAVQR